MILEAEFQGEKEDKREEPIPGEKRKERTGLKTGGPERY
jgi:hypothetical protein